MYPNKRKQAVRKYLYLEKPSLGFYDSNGNYKREAWKAFKTKYNITKATKQMLITAPGEDFFSAVKKPSSKNKLIQQFAPYAKEYFKVFLKSKGKYNKKPEAGVYLRPYDLEDYELGPWSNNAWDNEVKGSDIKLAIMDFRNVPGEINKS